MVNQKRILEEFCSLVAIDAVPFQERQMADRLKAILAQLGFTVEEDEAGDCYRGNSGNIYAYLAGTLPGDPLLFSAHMDTVEPGKNKKAVLHSDGTITSDGTTVLGADDLSGVVSILEAIQSIREQGILHRSIEVLFTIAEEYYLKGSKIFDYRKIKAKEAYVLDLDGTIGTAAIKAPTVIGFTARFMGKASHAGFAPEQGINAIAVAAEAITAIQQGRIDKEMTVNIGLAEGGKARNIVSAECILKGEVRCLNHQKALERINVIRESMNTAVKKYGAKLEFSISFGCIAYEVAGKHPVVKRFQNACKELSLPVKLIETFGGSDNNVFLRNGITGIVMACGMHKVHSCNEYTDIRELVQCSEVVYKLMTDKE